MRTFAATAGRRLPSLDSVLQDIRYALRTLRQSAGFTVVAVSILALGIGANTAIFSLISAVLLEPLPFEEPDRLVLLWEDLTSRGAPRRTMTPAPANYVDWKERSRSFSDMAALESTTYNLTGEGEPERLVAVRATGNFFPILKMQPLVGRTFTVEDEGAAALPVAVISERLWITRFGADSDIVGRTINLDGLRRTVIGVVPADFQFPDDAVAVFVPASFTAEELARRGTHNLYVIARLAPGVLLSQAQAEMSAIAKALEQEYPDTNTGMDNFVTPLHAHLASTARPTLFVLLGAVGVILLITCANAANLLLARGASRQRELAVRKALGAGGGRVLRQLLTESAVLATVGAIVGVALSTVAFAYLARLIPPTYPDAGGLGLDWRVLSFGIAATLLTVLLFGAGPAIVAARLDFNETLKKGVGRSSAARSARIGNALVVGEITLTVVLLIAAGLLLRSYAEVLGADAGFRPQNLLVAETVVSPSAYTDPAPRSAFYGRVLDRVKALPGVESAGYVNYAPLVFKGGRVGVTLEGRPPPPPADFARYVTSDRVVEGDYLSALGVPLIAGRFFDERDVADAPPSVIINRAMARLHWPDEDPIGRRIRIGGPASEIPWYTIVGVVGDIRQMGLDVAPEPEMYFPHAQAPANAGFFWPRHLVVRTQGNPLALAAAVRTAVWEIDPNQPVSSIRTMSEIFDAELANRNTQLTLIGAFAALALVLASVGLYGVLSYTIAQRTSEIGLRMALGAQRATVVSSVLRTAAVLAALGIGLGLAGALGITRVLSSFLFGVTPTDPMTFLAVAALLLLVTFVASYVPARRAASVDPMSALRTD